MKFKICIKQVPDITAPAKIRDGELIMETDRPVLDAYSASAVEEALVLAEKYGGEVEVISAGPDKVKETIRKALAMGAHNATHILTEDEKYDSATYAKILAAHFDKREDYDVIALGKQSQDTDAGLTGSMLAELLGMPYVTNAVGLDLDTDQKKMIVTRQADTAQEVIELPVPCIVTCSNDMNDPRIPSLKGIMQSKRKPVESVSLADLELDTDQLRSESMISVVGYEEMPEREPGKKLEGEPEELAQQLVDLLDNEAKVL